MSARQTLKTFKSNLSEISGKSVFNLFSRCQNIFAVDEENNNDHIQNILSLLFYKNPKLINCTDQYRKQPLHFAVEYAMFELVLQLLKMGADPNAKDCDSQTPLFFVKNPGILHIMLKHGAHIDVQSRHRESLMACLYEKSAASEYDLIFLFTGKYSKT